MLKNCFASPCCVRRWAACICIPYGGYHEHRGYEFGGGRGDGWRH